MIGFAHADDRDLVGNVGERSMGPPVSGSDRHGREGSQRSEARLGPLMRLRRIQRIGEFPGSAAQAPTLRAVRQWGLAAFNGFGWTAGTS